MTCTILMVPCLIESRIFLHKLQCNQDLNWDQVLDKDCQRQWRNIARQANAAPPLEVERFVGNRNDSYNLLAFSDSSKAMLGVVIFIQSTSTGKVSFVIAKNCIVNKQLESKSIPSLELQGIALAVECLLGLYDDLSGPSCVRPIKIVDLQIYSDSLVALSWIYSYSVKLDKLQKMFCFCQKTDYITLMNSVKSIQLLLTLFQEKKILRTALLAVCLSNS